MQRRANSLRFASISGSPLFARKLMREFLSLKSLDKNSGFTMVEVVIVVLLFGVLAGIGLFSVPSYLSKRRDNQRKADLHNMKIAFEDYNNDNDTYPPVNMIQSCNSTAIAPYMKKVPCDPKTKAAYSYILSADGQGYQLYTLLENTNDADVATLGCQAGCGPGDAYNYGVVGGTSLLDR